MKILIHGVIGEETEWVWHDFILHFGESTLQDVVEEPHSERGGGSTTVYQQN